MTKHVMSITYNPKIEPVKDGRCTQTIRSGRRFEIGDEILLHGWEGRPYRSKWDWRKRVLLTDVSDVVLDYETLTFITPHGWDSKFVDIIAEADFIYPPTGIELKSVLEKLRGGPLTDEPEPYQIIGWD